jgi:hypothetical protein
MLPGSRLTQDKNNVMSISTTQKAMVTVDGTARSLARFREMKYCKGLRMRILPRESFDLQDHSTATGIHLA